LYRAKVITMERAQFKGLPEFVSYLRTHLNNVSPAEALDQLQELIGRDVSIKYEMVAGEAKETPPELKNNKFAHVAGQKLSRILLSTNKRYGDLSSDLMRQLNGVIFQYPGWKVLCVPAPMLNTVYSKVDLARDLSNYHIYPVIDGTVVTLYWYEPEASWRLSTTNGYDVTNFKWLSNKTYMEAINELAAAYPDFSLEKLDHGYCYTIGFRHHDFQPLLMDPQRLWFIQACNTAAMNVTTVRANISDLISHPSQIASIVKNSSPVLTITTMVNIGLPVQTPMAFAAELAADAVVNNLIMKNATSIEEFTKRGDVKPSPHYGFVLRPKSGAIVGDILLESALLQMIKKTLYNFPKKRFDSETQLNFINRMEYAKLRAYLSVRTKYQFLTLYPQFEVFNKVASIIVAIARKTHVACGPADRVAEIIAKRFSDHMDKQINVTGPDGIGMAMDFIVSLKYLEMYFTLMTLHMPF
jgi:hypothetical protein